MLTLLRRGYCEIVRLFYENKTIRLHLREIARLSNLFEASAYRFLNSLEKDNILKSEKEGNLKKYFIKEGVGAYFLFEAFDIERFENLSIIRKNAIKLYLDTLLEKPIFVVLFGSTAKKTYRRDSDIDVLLITNNKINVNKAQKEVNALTAMKINTFQINYKDFLIDLKMKEDKVVQSAINSGYPLINHIQYYGVLHNERI